MNGVKRLTPPQSRKVNALVRRTCCNYDNGNCILLDDGDECVCPQLISYSLLCKWFRAAVLPADRLITILEQNQNCCLSFFDFRSSFEKSKPPFLFIF